MSILQEKTNNESDFHYINHVSDHLPNLTCHLNICRFNTNGSKRNLSFLESIIINNDFIFICETWLLDSESATFLKLLSSLHVVLHKADMIINLLRGRPFGGCAFIVRKNLKILNYDFINKHISILTFSFNCFLKVFY